MASLEKQIEGLNAAVNKFKKLSSLIESSAISDELDVLIENLKSLESGQLNENIMSLVLKDSNSRVLKIGGLMKAHLLQEAESLEVDEESSSYSYNYNSDSRSSWWDSSSSSSSSNRSSYSWRNDSSRSFSVG